MTIRLEPLPPAEAIEYFRSKGFAPPDRRFDWRDIWNEEHARSFVVAKAMQDDVLATIRAAVDQALAEGQTLDQFRAALRPKLEAFGWWGRGIETDPLTGETREVRLGSPARLRTIFDTNMRTSLAAGRWAQIQRTKAVFPWLEYRQIDRPSKREAHRPYDGLILPVDDPLWLEIFPPNGWFCGCSVRSLNARMLQREGKTPSERPEVERVAWTNRRTGETERLPKGVDPGFGSNPGAAWLDLRTAHAPAAAELTPSQHGTEFGLIQEVRSRGLRDGEETAAVYDLDRPASAREGETGRLVLGWSREAEGFRTDTAVRHAVEISGAAADAMSDPARRIAIVHNHPEQTSVSDGDLHELAALPGLHRIVVVAHEGSIFAVVDRGLTRNAVLLAEQRTFDLLLVAVEEGGIRPEDASDIYAHLRNLALARAGFVRYDHALANRLSGILAGHAALVEDVVRLVVQELTE